MPKQYRYTLKQQLNRALKSLTFAEEAIIKVGHEYKDKYPQRYEGYCVAVGLISQTKEIVKILVDTI